MADYSSWLGPLIGGSSIGGGLYNLFGNQTNPSDAANKYISQIPGATNPYFQPYFQAGTGQLPGLEEQYKQLLGNPGGKLNEIGGEFQQSPGFKFALEQALQGSNNTAAAGGMAGSPFHTQQNMQLATDLANQDYYKWLQGAAGLYGAGLGGSQGLAGMGQQAGANQASMIANALAQQGADAYNGAMQKNQNMGGAFGSILGGLGAFFGL